MHLAGLFFVGLVALLHGFFLVLEMFLWQTPYGLKTFAMDAHKAELTSSLARNQGLYNGFLAAGLVWSLLHPDPSVALQLQRFFLGCVVVAGAYAGVTVSRRIFVVQSVPALIALVLTAL